MIELRIEIEEVRDIDVRRAEWVVIAFNLSITTRTVVYL